MTVENEITNTPIDTGTPVTDVSAPVDTSDAEMGAAFDKIMGGERDETGRFVGNKASLEGEDGAGDGSDVSTAPDQTLAPTTSAPAHMPQAIKAEWDKLPETARAAIAAHQTDMDRKFGELGARFNAVKPVADRFYEAAKFPDFQGMTVDQMAQGALELAGLQAQLGRGTPEQRADLVLQIAQRYGVLAPLQQKLSGQPVTANAGPNMSALEQKIAHLESQLSEKASPEYIRQQVSAMTEEQAAVSEVQSFAKTKEFWPEVQNAMPMFFDMAMQANPNATEQEALATAYDMAIYANPAVRAKVMASEARNPATVDLLSTKRSESAKKAASINVKPTITGSGKPLSEDDAMASAYDRAMAS